MYHCRFNINCRTWLFTDYRSNLLENRSDCTTEKEIFKASGGTWTG